jgi:cytochrome P450
MRSGRPLAVAMRAGRRCLRVEYEPFDPRWRRDPYPTYRALREQAPVHWAPAAACFCLSRYEDVVEVLRDPERFSSSAMLTMLNNTEGGSLWRRILAVGEFLVRTRINPLTIQQTPNLITSDPPRHDAMRAVVNRGFTPRRVRSWEGRAREIAAACVDRLRRGEPFDVVRDLAIPLPVTIIAELLGVAPERQLDFKRWSDAIICNSTGSGRMQGIDRAFMRTMADLYHFLAGVIAERRRHPGEDLISTIVAGQEGEATLSDLEVFQFVLVLLVAGNETTTNLIANAVGALLDSPEQLELVAESPALVPALVEESLRFEAPIQLLFRTAMRDAEIGGVHIPRGAVVAPILASANRDDARFPEGERFDVTRDAQGHVSFGFGVHFCLGASLARLEAAAALAELVPELARFERADDGRPLVDSFLVRGPTQLALVPRKRPAST